MEISRGYFNSYPCLWLKTTSRRISIALEGGLRILSYSFREDENLFAELGDLEIGCKEKPYPLIGGHRLWHAPEWAPRTYLPETGPFQVQTEDNSVTVLSQPDDSGISKAIRVELCSDSPYVKVTHFLKNHTLFPVTLAAWAITMFPSGGIVLCPQNTEVVRGNIATPNRVWVFWQFTDIGDERFRFGNRMTLLRAVAGNPTKLGYFSNTGFLAYWYPGWIFIKHFTPSTRLSYADLNANIEIYICNDYVELETLSPLTCLQPEEILQHTETWSALPVSEMIFDEEDAISLLGKFMNLNDNKGILL